jgi:F0F1-type ATP synthase assembly protein I
MAKKRKSNPVDYVINMGLAAIAGLSGFIGMIFIFGLLLVGLVADHRLGTSPVFTIISIATGAPVSILVMVFIALRSAKTIEHRQYGKRPDKGQSPPDDPLA